MRLGDHLRSIAQYCEALCDKEDMGACYLGKSDGAAQSGDLSLEQMVSKNSSWPVGEP